jgi:hypothetical protein
MHRYLPLIAALLAAPATAECVTVAGQIYCPAHLAHHPALKRWQPPQPFLVPVPAPQPQVVDPYQEPTVYHRHGNFLYGSDGSTCIQQSPTLVTCD